MNGSSRRRSERSQELASVHAILCGLLLVLLLQFLLLAISVEGFMAGKRLHLAAASAGSLVCFAGACGLIRYLFSGAAR